MSGADADGGEVEPTRPAPKIPARPRELRPLTGFRWLIGLALFLHHAVFFYMAATSTGGWSRDDLSFAQHLIYQGPGAVAFFFLLSGFTLTWNYAYRFRRLSARPIAQFLVNRIGSIWPIHLLAFALASVFVVDDLRADPAQVFAVATPALLLLQAWLPLGGADTWTLGFNGPSWSLSALLFFYACFPVLVALLGRLDRSRPRLLVALPLAWVAVTAFAAWAWRGDAYASWLFHTYPPVRLVDFVVGICACLLLLRLVRRDAPLALPGGRLGASLLELGAVALVGVAVVLASLSGGDLVPTAVRYSSWYVLPLALLVYVFARGGGLLSAVAGSRPLVWLGRISFPFLMLHVVVMQALFSGGIYARDPWLASIVAFGVSLLLSIVVHYWWEHPARRFIRARGGAWVDARFDAAERDAQDDENAHSEREADHRAA